MKTTFYPRAARVSPINRHLFGSVASMGRVGSSGLAVSVGVIGVIGSFGSIGALGGCSLDVDDSGDDVTFEVEDALRDDAHPHRGRYRELWIGPDFVRGKASAQSNPSVVDLGGFASAADWRETAAKSSVFQFRAGFLSRLFATRPIVDRRAYGADTCVRRPGTDATFEAMHQLSSALRAQETRISVEVGGTRIALWTAYRGPNGEPSILENFAAGSPSIGLGEFNAIAEHHLLKCFEEEFGLRVSAIVLDNSLSSIFVRQARSKEPNLNYPGYTIAEIHSQIASYLRWMKQARPGLLLALTEFPLEVTGSSGREFTTLAPEKIAYRTRFGHAADLRLEGLLDGIARGLGPSGTRIDAFFIDSSLEWEARDRQNLGAQPFERILAYESVAKSRGLKVGLYLQSAIADRRICDETPDYASCGEVMQRAVRCSNGQTTACARSDEELKDRNGRAYAGMTLDEIDESLGAEVSDSMADYVEQYLRRGGNPSSFNFQTWHPFPERIGRESMRQSWLSLATRVGRKVAPVNPPRETSSPASNLYRIPRSIWLIDRQRNATCAFPNYPSYQAYLRDHGLSNPVLPIFGNPPSGLVYEGKCPL